MEAYIQEFSSKAIALLRNLPTVEIAKAMNILQAAYERDGRIYVIGNGGSLALATHWVADFNKTVFSHNLNDQQRRFQSIRLPTTEEELTAWANDIGYEMVFAGPLKNYIQESDVLIYAIGTFGNGMGSNYSDQFVLRMMTEETGGRLFAAGRISLADFADKIVIDLRNRYMLGYMPKDATRDGRYHHITVKLASPRGLPKLQAHWRRGYYAPSR